MCGVAKVCHETTGCSFNIGCLHVTASSVLSVLMARATKARLHLHCLPAIVMQCSASSVTPASTYPGLSGCWHARVHVTTQLPELKQLSWSLHVLSCPAGYSASIIYVVIVMLLYNIQQDIQQPFDMDGLDDVFFDVGDEVMHDVMEPPATTTGEHGG